MGTMARRPVLTDAGWPRPRNEDGYPVPWISNPRDLGVMDRARHRQSIRDLLCQVCGEGHGPDDPMFIFVNDDAPSDPRGMIAQALDDGILHERCARLAYARCPELGRLRAGGRLHVYEIRSGDIEKLEGTGWLRNHLGADAERIREVQW